MTNTQLNRINYYNILAMLASACLAVVIPFELVLLSYAILGPAHYLTEISWLNERKFFTLKKYDYVVVVAVAIIAFLLKLPYGYVIFYTFGLSFILLVTGSVLYRVLAFCLLIVAGYFILGNNLLQTIFGLYMPTLIHVYFFTGAFMLFGALKDKIVSGYIAFFVFLACPLLLCVLFRHLPVNTASWAIHSYGDFGRLNTVTLKNSKLDIFNNPISIILTRLIAFAYTYHYINWFSKTRIINWHQVSMVRAVFIGVIWIASVALYFYNYRLGIKWLFLLSLTHVLLEFPLNHRSFIGIGRRLGWGKVHGS
ncbi:hypothetical protein [Mucilaginibacter sp.]|uniref:hypothetical protein n=1 Tax=Mucilaginibacter sp. TaxID=1882438 RepID=UPI002851D992|nr:hypothetical protein [Mucilaginibacter sp.]MDR3693046.1 hypothetical protein [Mucilaginibacter sp.]